MYPWMPSLYIWISLDKYKHFLTYTYVSFWIDIQCTCPCNIVVDALSLHLNLFWQTYGSFDRHIHLFLNRYIHTYTSLFAHQVYAVSISGAIWQIVPEVGAGNRHTLAVAQAAHVVPHNFRIPERRPAVDLFILGIHIHAYSFVSLWKW